MNKPLILVVEDDRSVNNLITTILKTHDYRYLTALNGAEAVLEASSHNPDIVLLDLGLPDTDGVDIIKKIRFAESLPQVEIVLSGMNTMEQLLDNLACRQPLTEYEQSVLFEAAGLLRNSIAVLYNEYKQNPGDGWKIAPVYQNMTASGGGPADCIGCKKCEGSCPQTLPITKFLSDVREAFDDRHS